jgi:uncharacterized protein YbgA (DUF1722 family)/uncharacterized protein YbbK (DUF523 family)
LGQKVRFDGGHKHDRYITDILGAHFRFVPVCPELEVGMGVPRESVRLEGNPESPRLIGNKTGRDWTTRIDDYARKRLTKHDLADLDGYILKKNSPSCGLAWMKVYIKPGRVSKTGVGIFARALMERFPHLPIEEEGRLIDRRFRENFIVRVFAYHRLRQLFNRRFSRRDMIAFHTVHKYLLLAHSPKHYRGMGKLVATIKQYSPAGFRERYRALFMETLAVKATAKKNVNVLQHILGFLKKHLNPDEKRDILAVIDDYYKELVPLIVPVTLIMHYIRKFGIEYIRDQVYLNPHPKELKLRNHV